MAEYTLYCFAQSGNAYKVALMLELLALDWAPRFVDFFGGETRTPGYREINPMGEVPVLEHRSERIAQSGVILDYLAATTGQLGARDANEQRELMRWILFDNHKFTSYTATYRFLRTFAANPNSDVMTEFRKRAEVAWGILDLHLRDRHYVVGDRLTIADISLCGYLYWPDEIGVDWSDYPGVYKWLERIAATPRWQPPYALMPGHPRLTI